MLDIGWRELLVIGALALIVVGPKDLPGLLRSLGQWTGKIRQMARDFQRSMNDAANEADLKDLVNIKNDIAKAVNPMDFKAQAANAQSFLKKSIDPLDEFDKTPKSDAADPATSADAADTPSPAGDVVEEKAAEGAAKT